MRKSFVRILIVSNLIKNLESEDDEKIQVEYSPSIFYELSFSDYHILIIDQAAVSPSHISYFSTADFDLFFDAPSVLACISRKRHGVHESNYDWLPFLHQLGIINKKGETLVPTENAGAFQNLFDAFEWEWECYFQLSPASHYFVLAKSIKGLPVALKAKINFGEFFVIPPPKSNGYETYPLFLRQLIDICKREYMHLKVEESAPPPWVEKYKHPLELKTYKDLLPIYQKYLALCEAKKLLYATGDTLKEIVRDVLNKMGLNVVTPKDVGIHDLEWKSDVYFVIEVTSSRSDWISLEKVRQVCDWRDRAKKKQKRAVKGILFANPHCQYPPPERDEPFTKQALTKAREEDICLITTLQLYNIFCRFMEGKISTEKIINLFKTTTGLLKLSKP